MKRDEIIQNLLYGILLSAFLLFYFILSMNSRLVADDFYFLKNFQDMGWWQSMITSWQSWVTRWSSILWLNVIFFLFRVTGNFLFFHIITILMLCFALYRLSVYAVGFYINQRTSKLPSAKAIVSLPVHSRFTVSLFISFFFLTVGIGETFFWITSSSMYLWGFIAFCFLLAENFKTKQSPVIWMICVLTAAFLGGAAEAIAIPALVLLCILMVFQLVKKTFSPSTIISIVVLLASIIISYSGPGRALRQSALPHHSLPDAVMMTFRSIAQIEINFLDEKSAWAALFFIAWMGFAATASLTINVTWKNILWIIAGYMLLCFIFVFPACYLLGDIPPPRATILVSFLNCCLVLLAGILTGAGFQKKGIIKMLSSVSVALLVVMICRLVVQQKVITDEYAHVVDARMQFLNKLVDPEDTTTIILDKLPEPGMLMSSDISSDPADFRNQHLKKFLGIKADLRVQE